MKKIIATISALIIATTINAQDPVDKKAKAILDDLSVKTKGYNTIKAEFTFTILTREKKTETQTGAIQMKGEKYKLEIKGQEIYSDGKTVWTYLKDAKEVQVNDVTPPSDDNISPASIFTVYEKGFKYKYDKEEFRNGVAVQIINLYPNNPDKKKFHTVKLVVDKMKKQVIEIVLNMKDGSTYTYKIKKFAPNTDMKDNLFTFDSKTHPGVEVVDLRE